MKLLILSLHLLCALASELIHLPQDTTGEAVGMVVVGREDVPLEAYSPLVRALQSTLAASKLSAYVAVRSDMMGVDITLKTLRTQYKVGPVYWGTHGMGAGATAVHDYVKAHPSDAKALLVLGGFLQRTHRPDVVACRVKAAVKPKKSIKCVLGCLEDGAHTCTGPNVVDFPVPVLTLSGDLDGVVRVARVGEAWYTQTVLPGSDAGKLPVVVVEGMNHAVLLNITGAALPDGLASRDLQAEITQEVALATVAGAFADFAAGGGTGLASLQTATAAFMRPVATAFVELEGNWMWTGADEEHGSSGWAAQAQQLMASPLPAATSWTNANEFHLVSDEDKIPPYYRAKHRANVNVVAGGGLNSSTVSQLRFLEISVTQAGIGLNGDAIITEEKLNVLSLVDDGSKYSSAIEIATKLASRQLVFNLTGNPSPESLDDGDRCGDINQAAYAWALGAVTAAQRKRFEAHGLPIKMIADTAPTPPAGPWWIWNYLQYKQTDQALSLQSYKAFYSLDANPYGAGNHYCKLLSPARALEWVLTDGLRPKYHV